MGHRRWDGSPGTSPVEGFSHGEKEPEKNRVRVKEKKRTREKEGLDETSRRNVV